MWCVTRKVQRDGLVGDLAHIGQLDYRRIQLEALPVIGEEELATACD